MRIRRRPPLSLPPPTSSSTTTPQAPTSSQLPDPAPPHTHPVNGWCGGKHDSNGDEKLHLAKDPQLHQLELVQDANRTCDSHRLRTSAGSSHYLSYNSTSQVQAVKSEVKEEAEERMVDSNRRSGSAHELQVNSKKSSNALALEATAARLGETALPPRRRRGVCNYATNDTASKARVKTRGKAGGTASRNDSCSGGSGSDNENSSSGLVVKDDAPNNGKKRRSPAVLMEGSRCSRVNGRGWRCCQQTLVGYSLCEHHLGKGRLRSMSSVRGQLGTSKSNANIAFLSSKPSSPSPSSSLVALQEQMQHQSLGAENNGMDVLEEEETLKKKKKSGTVKARSVTSLLSENRHLEATELPQPEEVALLLLGTRNKSNGVS